MTGFKPTIFIAALLLVPACDSSEEGEDNGSSTGGTTAVDTDADPTSTTGSVDPSTTSGSAESSGTSEGADTSTGDIADGSSSSSGAATTGGEASGEGDVVVTVAYDGALEGTMTVALFETCPPAGPPGAFVQEPEPAFPHTVELTTALVAGDMPCVIAYIDTGAPSPTSPGKEDPTGEVTFEIAAGEATAVDLSLEDPA